MAFVIADRVRETTTTTGTGTMSLAGAVSGFRSFVSAIGTGNNTYYVISDGVNWEVGIGTVTSGAPNTLSRDTVLSNSLGNTTKVSFGAGTKDVAVTLPAGKALVPEKAQESRQAIGLGTAATLNFGTGADDLLKTSAADQRYVRPESNATLANLTVSQLQVTTGAGIGVGTAAPSASVNLNMNDTFLANLNRFGIQNIIGINDETLTANRFHWAAENMLINRRRATNAFAVEQFGTRSTILNGNDNGSGSLTSAYAALNRIQNQATDVSYSTVDNAYGTYNHVWQYRTGTMTTAYGTYNRMDRDAGTLSIAYGVYNSFEGTIGTKWGIYSDGDDKNLLTGNLGLGIEPTRKLHVAGNGTFVGAGSNFVLNDTTSMLEVQATSGEAVLAFHRTGIHAIKVGLDANNNFAIGGWTWATGRLLLNSSGDLTVAGDFIAPVGAAAGPTYTFAGNLNTGLYRPAANQVGISTNGTVAAIINASNQYLAGTLGTAALPIFSFNADPNTGIFSPGADQLSVTTGGTAAATWNASNQHLAGGLGSAALPIFTFAADPNTGIYSPGADQLAITTAGTVSATFNAVGNVSFSSSAPGTFANGASASNLELTSPGANGSMITFHRLGTLAIKVGLDSDNFFKIGGYSWATNRLLLDGSGNLSIAGTLTAPNANIPGTLTVGGGINGGNACTAWVSFNGTGTPAIRGGYNVTSVTDNGTGDYTINFSTGMSNTNYAAVTSALQAGVNMNSSEIISQATGSVRVCLARETNGTRTYLDTTIFNCVVFGGK